MTTNVNYIPELTPEESASIIGMAIDAFKDDAKHFATNSGFSAQSPSAFNSAWSRWATGKQGMPLKVEMYIRLVHQVRDSHSKPEDPEILAYVKSAMESR